MSQRDVQHDDLDDFVAESIATDSAFASAYERAGVRSGLLRAMVTWRKHTKRSQATVAKTMGTTQSAVSDLEGGGSDPRFSTLDRYASAIGCRLHIEVVTEAGDRLYITPRPWRAMPPSALLVTAPDAGYNFEPGAWAELVEKARQVFMGALGPAIDSVPLVSGDEPPTGSDSFALAA